MDPLSHFGSGRSLGFNFYFKMKTVVIFIFDTRSMCIKVDGSDFSPKSSLAPGPWSPVKLWAVSSKNGMTLVD
jgi:hypothetical protein